jgi:hypothetical protein
MVMVVNLRWRTDRGSRTAPGVEHAHPAHVVRGLRADVTASSNAKSPVWCSSPSAAAFAERCSAVSEHELDASIG